MRGPDVFCYNSYSEPGKYGSERTIVLDLSEAAVNGWTVGHKDVEGCCFQHNLERRFQEVVFQVEAWQSSAAREESTIVQEDFLTIQRTYPVLSFVSGEKILRILDFSFWRETFEELQNLSSRQDQLVYCFDFLEREIRAGSNLLCSNSLAEGALGREAGWQMKRDRSKILVAPVEPVLICVPQENGGINVWVKK